MIFWKTPKTNKIKKFLHLKFKTLLKRTIKYYLIMIVLLKLMQKFQLINYSCRSVVNLIKFTKQKNSILTEKWFLSNQFKKLKSWEESLKQVILLINLLILLMKNFKNFIIILINKIISRIWILNTFKAKEWHSI